MSNVKLPKLLSELAEVIGLEATLKLAVAKGGTQIYVPAAVEPDHWLVDLLGLKAASALCEHFKQSGFSFKERLMWAGIPVMVPSGIQFRRRLMLEKARREGLSSREMALRLNVSERTISRWLKKWPARSTEPAE